jgi:hypothetical protein
VRRSTLVTCSATILTMLAVAPALADHEFVFYFAYGPGCS